MIFINFRNKLCSLISVIFLIWIVSIPAQNTVETESNNKIPPNILWITSEDNSPLLGCYGDEFATTPNLDAFAKEGVLYENAFANVPVCAPARSSLITGMYGCSIGTQNMRSRNSIPGFMKMYPDYLREAGYYCTNNSKTDYNIAGADTSHWDECSKFADYLNRNKDQPFFAIFNITISHEGQLHKAKNLLKHDRKEVELPPYHPDTPEMRYDWARYYDQVEKMDAQVGEVLQILEKRGLADNTIVFYYSDHGGVLARSKRFIYDSGTHVPMIIRFPKKYAYLAPGKPGTRTDRIVSFVDFAPTLLSLAKIPIPEYMQGEAFLGDQKKPEREYAFFFRDRMDERYDMMRSARSKQFQYIRNYYPYKIYGQNVNYLWKAPSTRSWEKEFTEGRCNEVQSRFWGTKPPEELYDVKNDPWEIHNLAYDKNYSSILKKMREATDQWTSEIKDTGFLIEGEMLDDTNETTIYDFVRSSKIDIDRIIKAANLASSSTKDDIPELVNNLNDKEKYVRYWGAVGLLKNGVDSQKAREALIKALNDPSANVRIVAAEALCILNDEDIALPILEKELEGKNVKTMLHALNALEDIGESAQKILPSIRRINEKSNDNYITRASKHLIKKFQ